MAETIGKFTEFCFDWRVRDFFSRSENSSAIYTSPTVRVNENSWVIKMYPDGDKSPGWISLFLTRLTTTGNTFVYFKLAIKNSDGSEYGKGVEHLFCREVNVCGWTKFVKKAEILREKNLMAPRNVLIISCTISSKPRAAWDATKRVQISNGLPFKRSKSLSESLERNLKDLFLSRKNSDIIIRVRGKDFPVHKMILSARSTVFAAMFEHNMTENLSGIVEISDANPDVFRDFLLFIYSGDVKSLSSENVYDLYALSDKYDLKDLKDECTSFMECTMSIETVCDVLDLSEKYNEVHLKESAKKYFFGHAAKILASDQWKTFESENGSLVIELLKSVILAKVSQ